MKTTPFPDWLACPVCDELHIRPHLLDGQIALCKNCGNHIVGRNPHGLDLPFALSLAALTAWITAILLPFIHVSFGGQNQTVSLPSAVTMLAEHSMTLLAAFVGLLLIMAPLCSILCMLYLLIFLNRNRKPPFYRFFLKAYSRTRFWDMTDVYLISILVVLVKAVHMADILLLYGFWAFCLQVLCIRLAFAALPPRDIWQVLITSSTLPRPLPGKRAMEAGLVSCHICTLVHSISQKRCLLCSSPLHSRKPQSINRTLALTLTAAILYFPANLYPIMITVNMGEVISSTILGGVILLWETGVYSVAIVVFFASVFIPLAKLIALSYLMGCVYAGRRIFPHDQTKLYKIVEVIGKWSMVDVFVVATLAAMVQMGPLATIEPGIAATAFAAMVVITLFAAETFDPRKLWDRKPEEKHAHEPERTGTS
nr:paraquat-inducible protein A [Desulfobotulus pelophilus]